MKLIQKLLNPVVLVAIFCAVISAPGIILARVSAAPTYVSPNYGVDEVFLGSGGVNDASSANFRARASLGDTGVGNSSSLNYQAYGGFTTTPDPYIELIVNPVSTELGYLSPSSTASTSATFLVRTYLASGYSVVNGSDPPVATITGGSHTLTALSTPTSPAAGTEQFGINLVANSSPTVGANVQQIPDNTYSFGQVTADYSTANLFKYVKGDSIAYSSQSSGSTQYTVSYMYNIADVTPGGEYVFKHIIIATSTF